MHFIEHIIEPQKLLMTWQDAKERTRYVVAVLKQELHEVSLTYLKDTKDFKAAQSLGFDAYPAFQDFNHTYHSGVMDAFMRRLPPKSRMDYAEYLHGLRIPVDRQLSDFALLGYSGARLASDGFSLIHTFENVSTPFEFLLESAGFRFIVKKPIALGQPVSFIWEEDKMRRETAIKIMCQDQHIGFVTRALVPVFTQWLQQKRMAAAWIEKMIHTPQENTAFIYVKISSSLVG